jgi:hypothetical protein
MIVFAQTLCLTNTLIAICSLLLFHPILATTATTTGIVSIMNTTGYLAQRNCVQSALWCGINRGASSDNIVIWLGCTNNLDSCFCRTDLASSASSLLTSGINSFCSTDPVDVSSGIAVYNSYCSRTVLAAITTGTSDSSTVTVTATVSSSTASITTPLSPREFLPVLICALLIFALAGTPS